MSDCIFGSLVGESWGPSQGFVFFLPAKVCSFRAATETAEITLPWYRGLEVGAILYCL